MYSDKKEDEKIIKEDTVSKFEFDEIFLKHCSKGGMIKKGMVMAIMLWMITKEKTYGYELIKKLNEGFGEESDENLSWLQQKKKQFRSNRIYPMLHILEKTKLIEGSWEMEGKRKIKYYEATEKGRITMKKLKILIKSETPPIFKEFFKETLFDD